MDIRLFNATKEDVLSKDFNLFIGVSGVEEQTGIREENGVGRSIHQ